MASLKEIKGRIASVRNTQKITSAMRMVSSAKLHRTQNVAQNFMRYADELHAVLNDLNVQPPMEEKTVKVVALIPISSSSGLCGAFNSNLIKATLKRIDEYAAQGIKVCLFPIGKKIAAELKKNADLQQNTDYATMNERVEKGDAFSQVQHLMTYLTQQYHAGEIHQVEMIYHHFKSMGQQLIQNKRLAMAPPITGDVPMERRKYLTEPSPQELANSLHPNVLNAEFYAALLDSLTSEHAARMLAMQTADDNANELLHELTLLYNKTRQQAITNELIDIMGGKIVN